MVFEQPHEHAQRCVGLLKEKGCEFIVALTHLSLVAWIDLIRCLRKQPKNQTAGPLQKAVIN